MEETTFFVNEALTYGIKSYLSYKQTWDERLGDSFFVSFLQGLCFIYGELDILIPYQMGNVNLDGGLVHNLAKYGYPKVKIQKMFDELQRFYEIEKESRPHNLHMKNPYFAVLQKKLIDMFLLKYQTMHLDISSMEALSDYLYFPNSTNEYKNSINQLLAEDPNEVLFYYRSKRQSMINPISFHPIIYNPIPKEMYSFFHIDIASLDNKTQKEIDEINAPILERLHVNLEDPSWKEKMENAIERLKNPQVPLTSGNGKVDLILLVSFIATELMILLFIGVRLLG